MLHISGWSPHKLMLNIGTIMMPFYNLDLASSLCNKTQLMIKCFTDIDIEVEVLMRKKHCHITFISRTTTITK